jgi:hypothetical protein
VLGDARFETHSNFPVLEDVFNENVVKSNLAIDLWTETFSPF